MRVYVCVCVRVCVCVCVCVCECTGVYVEQGGFVIKGIPSLSPFPRLMCLYGWPGPWGAV